MRTFLEMLVEHEVPTHPHYQGRPHIIYSHPYYDLGSFMDFDQATLQKNKRLGALKAYQSFGKYSGKAYCFYHEEHPIFENFYRFILFEEMERRSLLNDEDALYTIKLKEKNQGEPLTLKDYSYLVLDDIGRMCDLDLTRIYHLDEFMNLAFKQFSPYLTPNLSLPRTLKSLKGQSDLLVTGIIMNLILYPRVLSEDFYKLKALFPYAYLSAEFLLLYFQKAIARK